MKRHGMYSDVGIRVKVLMILGLIAALVSGMFSLSAQAAPAASKPTQKLVVPPSVRNDFGEANVIREMPRARYEFGAKTDTDYDRFEYMVILFEYPGGFQSEAEMEAARRVLDIPESFVENIFRQMEIYDESNPIIIDNTIIA
jgi:hypothetical protein